MPFPSTRRAGRHAPGDAPLGEGLLNPTRSPKMSSVPASAHVGVVRQVGSREPLPARHSRLRRESPIVSNRPDDQPVPPTSLAMPTNAPPSARPPIIALGEQHKHACDGGRKSCVVAEDAPIPDGADPYTIVPMNANTRGCLPPGGFHCFSGPSGAAARSGRRSQAQPTQPSASRDEPPDSRGYRIIHWTEIRP